MDEKANLFKEYLRLLDLVKPKMFVFENVVGLMSMQKGQLFKQICNAFKEWMKKRICLKNICGS